MKNTNKIFGINGFYNLYSADCNLLEHRIIYGETCRDQLSITDNPSNDEIVRHLNCLNSSTKAPTQEVMSLLKPNGDYDISNKYTPKRLKNEGGATYISMQSAIIKL